MIPRRAWEQWRFAKRQEAQWKKIKEDRRAILEEAIGSAVQAVLEGDEIAVISWKEGEKRKVFNTAQFKKDHPDLYAEYEELKPGNRPFNETVHAAELDAKNEDDE